MKLLLIFVDADHAADVADVLERSKLPGWSEIPNVLGRGTTGRKLGTRAFPGSSTLFFAVVPPDTAQALTAELRRLRADRGAEEGIKLYLLDTREVL